MIYYGIVDFSVNNIYIKLSENNNQIEINSTRLGDNIINTKTGRVRPVLIVLWDSKTNSRSVYSEIPESCIPKTSEEFRENIFDLDLHLGIWFDIYLGEFYLVRDIFGTTPVFYNYHQSELTFSSNVNGIFEKFKGDRTFNNTGIIYYLKSINFPTGYDLTYFNEVKRLSPGNYLQITSKQSKTVSYLRFDPNKFFIQNGTLDEYGSVFKQKLAESLIRNVDDNSKIGFFLSGGLDSSSISVLMRSIYQRRDIYTYFYDSGGNDNSDRPYVDDVVSSINSIHKSVIPQYENLHFLEEHIIANAGPSVSISGGLPNRFIREVASKDEVSILLSGHCGDNIADHGYKYIREVFENRHWEELNDIQDNILDHVQMSYDLKSYQHLQNSKIIFNNIIYNRLREKKSFNTLFNTLKSIGNFDTAFYVMKRLIQDTVNKLERLYYRDNILVRKEILNEELKYEGGNYHNQNNPFSALSTKEYLITEELETLNLLHKTKVRFPFLDKELYELCLAAPNKLKYNNGLTRGTLRAGMKGLLPLSVSNRVTKHIFGENMNDFSRAYYKYYADYLLESSPVWEYIDKKTFSHALNQINKDFNSKDSRSGIYGVNVFKTISLAIWLNHYSK